VPEIEDPVTTLVRLLQYNVRVVNEDGSLATVYVSHQWYDRELLKNYDVQVTVGLERSDDEKIGFSGTVRRCTVSFRVNVWAVDRPELGVAGRKMRDKTRTEVNRVIREKRTKPNETLYSFYGVGPTVGSHKAFHAGSAIELPPDSASWTELTSTDYEKLWASDNNRYSKSVNANLQYASVLFRLKIDPERDVVKNIVLRFEGYGTAPAGNGVTVKAWNHAASEWQLVQTGTGGEDESITITLSSSIMDFIDVDGNVYLLSRTTNASDGVTAAVLFCDYVECVVTVEGITYVDVVSFRDENQVNVKPFVWRTEFSVKSWLFENVTTT
jgi:hypothetical protein